MNLSRNQQTISKSCRLSGQGYWSGECVQVVLNPSPVGTGVRLVRADLPGSPGCVVSSGNRSDAQLRTNFRSGEASFQMVEHLLSALYALQVDNCIVEVDAEEFPGLDGSCLPYVQAITGAGIVSQTESCPVLVVDRAIRIEAGDRWIEASPPKASEAYFEYRLGFDRPCHIPSQTFGFELEPAAFAAEVAPARTFVTETQANMLRGQGVASHVTNQDLLVYGADGPIENELRFEDECSRHKTLDLIGDLAVSGIQLAGRFVSHRGGHSLNGRMAKRLFELAVEKGLMDSPPPSVVSPTDANRLSMNDRTA